MAANLQEAIDQYVRANFPAGDIVSVVVGDPYKSYGPLGMIIVDVSITARGTPREVARKELAGFMSGMRKHLAELGEEAFPLVAFRPTDTTPRPA